MSPSEIEQDPIYESRLRQGQQHSVMNLGLWPLETLPPSVLKLRDLRAISLGAVGLGAEEGAVVRNEWVDSEDYWMERPFHDLCQLKRFAALEYVDLSCCRAISDLAPLARLPHLKGLYLFGNSQLSDFSALSALKSLEELDASETAISDYSVLAGLPRLRKIILFGKRGKADLRTLAALPHLEELQIIGDGTWKELGFLGSLSRLQRIKISKLRAVSDWSPLATVPQLRHLYIEESPALTEFAPLKPLLPQLDTLFLRQELSDLPIKHQSEEDYSRRRGIGWLNCVESVRKYFKPGRKKPPATKSDVPAVPDSLYDDLLQAVRREIRKRLKSGDLPTTDDGLYALGVFVHLGDDGWVTLYHQTIEGLSSPQSMLSAEDLAELGLSPDDLDEDEDDSGSPSLSQKWSPAEWGTFDPIAKKELKAILKACNLKKLNETGREAAYRELEVRAPAAIILALRDLDRQNSFGPSQSRGQLTLLAGLIDNEENPETVSLTVAVRILNPAAVADSFLDAWAEVGTTQADTDEPLSKAEAIARADASELQRTLAGRLTPE